MATIIWKEPKPQGTAKSRYKARRAAKVAERSFDDSLARNFAKAITGCSRSVFSAVNAPHVRTRTDPELVAHEHPVPSKARKVRND